MADRAHGPGPDGGSALTADGCRIARIGAQGDGVVETADGTCFVAGTLPGELVDIAEGRLARIREPSPERRPDRLCPHTDRCGGCTLQHMSDAFYRGWKAGLLGEALAAQRLDAPVAPMISAPLGSRRRAVLTARNDAAGLALGFHGMRSHELAAITHCAVLSPAIVRALPGLRSLAAILLAPGTEARVSVTLTSHGLDVDVAGARGDLDAELRARLAEAAARCGHPIARLSANGAPMLARASPMIAIAGIDVVVPPAPFLQATVEAEVAMQQLAAGALGKARRVADLFSGLGTLTFALARRARVLAIDADRALIDALAAAARRAPGLKPIETRVRDLYRDPLSRRELDLFDAVVLDPPRAGAKAQAAALAGSKVCTVIAVSCNPTTLARDLRTLVDGGYRIERVTPVDQFLYSPHLEAVAVLRR